MTTYDKRIMTSSLYMRVAPKTVPKTVPKTAPNQLLSRPALKKVLCYNYIGGLSPNLPVLSET
jgi:hypothetical protein